MARGALYFGLALFVSTWTGIICQGLLNNPSPSEMADWTGEHFIDEFGFTLKSPSINHVSNLTLSTIIIAQDNYVLKMKVKKFSLHRTTECTDESERLTIKNATSVDEIVWCGNIFAEEVLLPRKVIIMYNTGMHGQGDGFLVEFTSVLPICSDMKLEVTTQPKLIYSPGYPDKYFSKQICRYEMRAPKGHIIHIQTRQFELEVDRTCRFDSLTIEGENTKYCLSFPESLFLENHVESIVFQSDDSLELSGFVLEYVAVKQERFYCNQINSEKTHVLSSSLPHVLYLDVEEPDFSSSTKCTFSIDSGSYDKVLALTISNMDQDCSDVSMRAYDDTSTWQLEDCPQPFHRLHTPSSSFKLEVESAHSFNKFLMTFQAIMKDDMAISMKASSNTSFVWISKDIIRNETQVLSSGSEDNCLLFEAHSRNMIYSHRDRLHADHPQSVDILQLSHVVALFNGPTSDYFELTRDCNYEHRTENRLYTLKSKTATVQVKRSDRNDGFWLVFRSTGHCFEPAITVLDEQLTYKASSELKYRKLHCRWLIPNLKSKPWRLRSNNTFNATNSLIVDVQQGSRSVSLANISKDHGSGLWLYSRNNENITVSVQHMQEDTAQMVEFNWEFHVLSRSSVEQSVKWNCETKSLVASRVAQTEFSPNYPNFYIPGMRCSWTISHEELGDRWNIFVVFSNVICGNQDRIAVYFNLLGFWRFERDLCDAISSDILFPVNLVKLELYSTDLVNPGFNFTYQVKLLNEGNNCNRTVLLDKSVESEVLYGSFPIQYHERNIQCRYQIHTNSFLYVVDLQVEVLNLNADTTKDCSNSFNRLEATEEYSGNPTQLTSATICGAPEEPKSIRSRFSNLNVTLFFHWDIVKAIEFRLVARRKQNVCSGIRSHEAKRYEQYLTSPGYPSEYPQNTQCEWRIYVQEEGDNVRIRLRVLDAEMKSCEDDYVDIFDGLSPDAALLGRICNNAFQIYESSSRDLFLVFKSQQSRLKGFQVGFSLFTAEQTGEIADSQDTTGATIGGILGSFVLVVGVSVAFIIVLRRKHRRSQDRSETNVSVRMNGAEPSMIIVSPVFMTMSNASPPPYPGLPDNSQGLPPYPASEYTVQMGHPTADLQPPRYDAHLDHQESSEPDLPPPYSSTEIPASVRNLQTGDESSATPNWSVRQNESDHPSPVYDNAPVQPPPSYDNELAQPPPSYDNELAQPPPSYDNEPVQPTPIYDNELAQPPPSYDNELAQPPPSYDNEPVQPTPIYDNEPGQLPPTYEDTERQRERRQRIRGQRANPGARNSHLGPL